MGRERQFSFRDVVRISVAADLTRLGINIATAGRLSGMIDDRQIYGGLPCPPGIDPSKERWVLLLVPSTVAGEPAVKKDVGEEVIVGMNSMLTLEGSINHALDYSFVGGRPASYTIVEITPLVARVRAALEHPEEVGFGQAAGS
jgi:hypothetical protein